MVSDFSIEEVFQAYLDCRKNKRTTKAQVGFEQDMERNLCALHRELNDRTYSIGRTRAFVVEHPKHREVWAGQFRDRVVHHVMYSRIFDRFFRRFIYDTYACVPGRGVLHGANRVHKMMRQATENWQRRAWFIQADLANFFVSIDKGILEDLLFCHVHEPELRWLVSLIVRHDPTADPLLRSPPALFRKVPWHKSLFNAPKGKGLPIGNLSSQYFGNVYLNSMDQFAKRELGVRWYGRYVDDVVMIGHCHRTLHEQFQHLCEFVANCLLVHFHPRKTVANLVERGINFCGYVLLPFRKYVRRRTARSMRQAELDPSRVAEPEKWVNRMNSYLGHISHANTFDLRKGVAQRTGAWFSPGFTKMIREGR